MGGVAILPAPAQAQINTPQQTLAQAASFGDLLAQKQVRQQQAQENAIKLQQLQQAQQDQQNFQKAYTDSGYDMDKALALAPQYGVSPDGLATRAEAHQKFQTSAAQLSEAQLNQVKTQGNQIAGYLIPIKSIQDPDQKAAAYASALQDATAKGLIKPGDPNIPATYPGDDALEAMISKAMGATGYAEYGLKTKQAAREQIQADAEKTKAAAEQTKIAGQELAAAQNQDDWDATIAKYPGSDKTFGTVFSPAAVKHAGDITITPEQRATAAATAAYREGLEEDRKSRLDQSKLPSDTQLGMRSVGAKTGNPAIDVLTPQQAKDALAAKKERAANPAAEERMNKEQAIRDAYRDSGYDWNKVTENVKAGKYGDFASDIADHADKMTKLPPTVQQKVVAADTTKQQVQAGIDAIREVVKNHPELVGNLKDHPINAIRRKGETWLGNEPADIGATDAILETAMALQPGQHNFRSVQALADFKKAVGIDPKTGKADGSRGWLTNPDKVIAGLQGISDFNDNLKSNYIKESGRGQQSTPPAAPAATHQLNGRPIALDPKNNQQWIYTDAQGGIVK